MDPSTQAAITSRIGGLLAGRIPTPLTSADAPVVGPDGDGATTRGEKDPVWGAIVGLYICFQVNI